MLPCPKIGGMLYTEFVHEWKQGEEPYKLKVSLYTLQYYADVAFR